MKVKSTTQTKSINIFANSKNIEAINHVPIYSNSPWYIWTLTQWASEIESHRDCIALTSFPFSSERREKEIDEVCLELEKLGITYSRTITITREREL